ncbi:sensor histidine kinase [Leptospira yasudae]|nr:histidine kinase [Leptospira yasudae]
MEKRGTLFFLFFDFKGILFSNVVLFSLGGSGIYFSVLRDQRTPADLYVSAILFLIPLHWALVGFLVRNSLKGKFNSLGGSGKGIETGTLPPDREFLGSRIYNLRMTPHFLFNSLMTLRIYMESERDDAVEYLDSLSNMLRYSFRFVDRDRVSLREELDFTLSYFDLVKNKTKHPFRILIKKEVGMEIGKVFVPPFLIQTLVENSVKHAVMKSKHSIVIEVEIGWELEDRIRITVQDNGPGARIARDDLEEGTFFYLRRRLKEICTEADLRIQSEIGNGFKTEISLYDASLLEARSKIYS